MSKVLITGASGFIGQSLCKILIEAGYEVTACIRKNSQVISNKNISIVRIDSLNQNNGWDSILKNVSIVIHLAARVHIMNKEDETSALELFRESNLNGTKNLALQAVNNQVKRFIYLSTIKVNGEQSDRPFHSDDLSSPRDPYAISKWEAEQVLKQIAQENKMEVVVIRPPLVYGPGVKGNFLRLIKLVDYCLPIPLESVKNKRSMVNIDNLCDLIKVCIEHPKAKGEVFLVSDSRNLSTPELIRIIAKCQQRPLFLFPLPLWILHFVAKLVGKNQEINRLCGSLQVNIHKNKQILNWTPRYSIEEGVQKTIAHQKNQI